MIKPDLVLRGRHRRSLDRMPRMRTFYPWSTRITAGLMLVGVLLRMPAPGLVIEF